MATQQILVSQISGGVGMQNLADNTLGGSAASATFSSISQGYKHLQLFDRARTSEATTFDREYMQCNSDTGANYDWQQLAGTNTTATSGPAVAQTQFSNANVQGTSDSSANEFSATLTTFTDYTNATSFKSYTSTNSCVDETAANVQVSVYGGQWRNAAAGVNAIKIFVAAGGNLVTGSRFTLQGVQ